MSYKCVAGIQIVIRDQFMHWFTLCFGGCEYPISQNSTPMSPLFWDFFKSHGAAITKAL